VEKFFFPKWPQNWLIASKTSKNTQLKFPTSFWVWPIFGQILTIPQVMWPYIAEWMWHCTHKPIYYIVCHSCMKSINRSVHCYLLIYPWPCFKCLHYTLWDWSWLFCLCTPMLPPPFQAFLVSIHESPCPINKFWITSMGMIESIPVHFYGSVKTQFFGSSQVSCPWCWFRDLLLGMEIHGCLPKRPWKGRWQHGLCTSRKV